MSIVKTIIFLFFAIFVALPSLGASLLRDADIENAFSELSKPILQAAGLSPVGVKIMLIDDMRRNAFVIDNKHIFITIGLAMRTRTPEMFQSIIAHEAAHIAYGHVSRRRQNISNARSIAAFGIALGVMTGAFSSSVELGTSLALGATSSTKRAFLAHTRAEESSADQAAMSYMAQSRIDGKGMADVLDIFIGQENLSVSLQDPYARSHPSGRDRRRVIDGWVASQPKPKQNKTALYWHDRAVGKLSAVVRDPDWTLKNAQSSKYKDVEHLRRGIALSLQGKLDAAIQEIINAQNLRPNDAYLQDLKAELYMKNKKFKRASLEYRKASELARKNALILAGYGRALLASKQTEKALSILKQSRQKDFRNPRMLRDLAVAFYKTGNNGMASLITAERFALQGETKDAKIHARRALEILPRGSPGWQSSKDILETK